MDSNKTYVYCDVLPANYHSSYFYICDFDVKPGDIVIISIRNDSNVKAALVLDVNEYTEENAPYPPQRTKHILRPFGDNESADLVKEKVKVEAEKAVRFKSAVQIKKLSIKESLSKYGVGKKKINDSKKKLKDLIENISDRNEVLDDLVTDIYGGIQLSADGKTVTGFKTSKVKGKSTIRIPSGVEAIEDNAFLRVKIGSLFLPKELKYLGKYTLREQYGALKDIDSIEVEDGNECFFSDGIGFYSIENGKKKLECLVNSNITVYTAPDDVAAFAENAFSNGSVLRKIVLSEGVEEFYECSLSGTTEVEEIYIPKTLKKLYPNEYYYETRYTLSYHIDEENECLFRDEDSIYEVLEDGTYKLLINLYYGKGKVLILEGTSVIGKYAFEGHENFTKIDFPKSLRIIEESAFESTALKNLVIPDCVVNIGKRAFSDCDELKDVTLSPNIETIASDTFEGCWKLQKIKTDGNKKAFTLKNGVVTKISSGNTGGSLSVSNSQYACMNEEDGKEFDDIVVENGGDIRSSTALDTNYLTVLNDASGATSDNLKMLALFEFKPGDSGFIAKFKGWSLAGFEEKNVIVPLEKNGKAVETFDLYGIPNFVQKITIPDTITSLLNIESSTLFYNSGSSLDKIEISDDNPMYWSDGYSIFSKDKKTLLRFMSFRADEYTVPEGTETVGLFAFCEMKNLTKIVLPKTIKKIDIHAFCDCEKLTDIIGIELVSEVGDDIFERRGGWYSSDSVPYLRNIPMLILGSTLIRYNDLSEKVIKIPDGITKIQDSAFGYNIENDNVEEIILPSSVTVLGRAAFCGRKKLKKINIPKGVKEIPIDVFKYCEQIEIISIPASVAKIDISAFPTPTYHGGMNSNLFHRNARSCALKAIEVDSANEHYCSIDGMLLSKDKTELLFIPNAIQETEFEIPLGVKKISSYTAENNKSLVELVITDSVTEIQKSAFNGCVNLKKVVMPEGLETIGEDAFSNCKNLENVVWPRALRSIGDRAFKDCDLTAINLPETVEHIGEEAFANTSVEKVSLPKSVRTLGWGAFSCVPEIEVYDSIDPEASDASKCIDTLGGRPNSMVGYIGMGSAWARWDCAANHNWVNYTIVVRSAETEEIKYKVWMGADGSQRDYYCFLSSGWGHNATFAFEQLDKFFPKIRGKDNKLQVARYRLEYPYGLTDAAKAKYESYIKKNS